MNVCERERGREKERERERERERNDFAFIPREHVYSNSGMSASLHQLTLITQYLQKTNNAKRINGLHNQNRLKKLSWFNVCGFEVLISLSDFLVA